MSALSRQADRLLGLLSWARVAFSSAVAARLGKIQTRVVNLDGTNQDDEFDHWQSYGFQSRPLAGADAIIASMGSHSDQRIALLVGDRRYTIALVAGEVAIADDLGQKVHLTRTGIVVDADSIKLGASASLGVARATDPVGTTAAWDTWLAAVGTGSMAGPPPANPIGTITTGSSVTRSE